MRFLRPQDAYQCGTTYTLYNGVRSAMCSSGRSNGLRLPLRRRRSSRPAERAQVAAPAERAQVAPAERAQVAAPAERAQVAPAPLCTAPMATLWAPPVALWAALRAPAPWAPPCLKEARQARQARQAPQARVRRRSPAAAAASIPTFPPVLYAPGSCIPAYFDFFLFSPVVASHDLYLALLPFDHVILIHIYCPCPLRFPSPSLCLRP